MLRRDTVSISDTAHRFAEQVAVAYIANDWLMLGDASYDTAVRRVRDMAMELYAGVLDDLKRNGTPTERGFTFHSSGRVKVIYWYWENDGEEIEFLLDVETEVKDERGRWSNLRNWDEEVAVGNEV